MAESEKLYDRWAKMWGRYRWGRVFAALMNGSLIVWTFSFIVFIILGLLFSKPYGTASLPSETGEKITFVAAATLVISTVSLVVSIIGTASAAILGWRADRRQVQQLKRELAEAKEEKQKRLDTD
jgi:hypothetical protein